MTGFGFEGFFCSAGFGFVVSCDWVTTILDDLPVCDVEEEDAIDVGFAPLLVLGLLLPSTPDWPDEAIDAEPLIAESAETDVPTEVSLSSSELSLSVVVSEYVFLFWYLDLPIWGITSESFDPEDALYP